MALVRRLCALVLAAAAACATVPRPAGGFGEGIRFSHRAPGARAVNLLASFADWQPQPMAAVAASEFALTLPVPPGEHRFCFQVIRADGSRVTESPAEAEGLEDDGFGTKNGILRVDAALALPGNPGPSGSSVGTGSN